MLALSSGILSVLSSGKLDVINRKTEQINTKGCLVAIKALAPGVARARSSSFLLQASPLLFDRT